MEERVRLAQTSKEIPSFIKKRRRSAQEVEVSKRIAGPRAEKMMIVVITVIHTIASLPRWSMTIPLATKQQILTHTDTTGRTRGYKSKQPSGWPSV